MRQSFLFFRRFKTWTKNKLAFSALALLVLAAAFLPGCAVSPAANSGSRSFNPFFFDHVARVRIVMSESDWQDMRANAFTKSYYKADFWFDNELVPNVGVRTKGNASLGQTVSLDSPRLPLAVDFNILNQDRSFHGLKKVHFNNGWSDPTLLRDVISYQIFAEMGIPTPRASLVDMYVNDVHLGVYTMVEAVDRSMLERYFTNTYGNLYKPEVVAARLDWTEKNAYKPLSVYGMSAQTPPTDPLLNINFGGVPFLTLLQITGQLKDIPAYKNANVPQVQGDAARGLPSLYIPHNLVEAVGLKTNVDKPNYTALFRFLDVLNNTPDDKFPQEIEKVLDVDEALRFFAVSAGIVHLDNYIGIGHNTYFYEVNGKFYLIPWDLNMTFGTFNAGIRKDGIINYYIDEPTSGPMARFPLVNRLLSYKPYLDKYHEYLQQLLDGPFALDTVLPRIDRLSTLIRPYADNDTEMFYSPADCLRCLTEDLRPPDSFEGWQAGGPSPALPFMLSSKEMSALMKNFGMNNLFSLLSYNFTPGDLDKLKDSLTETNYHLFLQNRYGPMEAPQPPRQPGFGPNSLGLKTYITARWQSVRDQLDGKRPAGPARKGAGNGASMWIADMWTIPK